MITYFITRQTVLNRRIYPLSVLEQLEGEPLIGFDFETTGLDAFKMQPVMLGLVTSKAKYLIDFTTFDPITVGQVLEPYIGKGTWIAHNAQFDAIVLRQHLKVAINKMTFWCSMVASQVLYNGGDMFSHGYDDLVAFHFHKTISKEQRNSFINRNMDVPITAGELAYLEGDLEFLIPLHDKQLKLLQNKEMDRLMLEIENPLIPVLADMHLEGININQRQWLESAHRAEKEVDKLVTQLKGTVRQIADKVDLSSMVMKATDKKKNATTYSLFTPEETYSKSKIIEKFNPASPAQIALIFNKLGIRMKSTGAELIEKELTKYDNGLERDFMDCLLKLRKQQKIVTTYGRSFLTNVTFETGKIHTSYTQTFTDTGRLSSRKPNMQNIPATKEMRSAFIPDSSDFVLVTCDFEGQELRIAAAYSKDEKLIQNFTEGLDLHSYLAQGSFRLILGEPDLIVSKKENEHLRDLHKRCLFGHIYGAQASRQAQVLNVSVEKAKHVPRWLNIAMPQLAEYQTKVKRDVLREGKMTDGTIYNRRKIFRNFRKKALDDAQIESQGANFPIQGTAASMTKKAMITCYHYLHNNGLAERGNCIKLQVHDELVFQIRKTDIEHAEVLKRLMEEEGTSFLRGVIPMKSSMGIAEHWKK